ncbi:MAG: ABC transporter permease, partial [Geminicoccaceae bacterium]
MQNIKRPPQPLFHQNRLVDAVHRFLDGDVFYSFKRSPIVVVAFVITVCLFLAAIFAPWLAPHDTSNVASLNLMDAFRP